MTSLAAAHDQLPQSQQRGHTSPLPSQAAEGVSKILHRLGDRRIEWV
jgi:hypothetical protein